MWKRKEQKLKFYEYSTPGEANTSWTEVSYPLHYDEYDVAEEVAQYLWDQGDSDGHDELEHGKKILVREKGSDKVTEFTIEVDWEPQFYVRPVV